MNTKPLSLFIYALLSLAMFIAAAPELSAQNFSGRGVDMRSMEQARHSCREPAFTVRTELIQVSITIRDILECNEKGGFYREDGSCDIVVSPGHEFFLNDGSRNEDALAFVTGGGTALIGGPDGETVTCCSDSTERDRFSCPSGQSGQIVDHYSVNCDTGARTFIRTTDNCTDLACEDDPDHPDYPDCGACTEDHNDVACCDDFPDADVCDDDCDPETDPECPGFCDENPDHEDCVDDCDPETDPECPGFCDENPDHADCKEATCTACSTTLTVNGSVTVYNKSSLECDEKYTSTNITCQEAADGSGEMTTPVWGSTYYCDVPREPDDCGEAEPSGCDNPCNQGQTISHDGSITVYKDETLGCGDTATSGNLSCTDGSLSAPWNYVCTAPDTSCDTCSNPCKPDDTISHNGSITMYQSGEWTCAPGASAPTQQASCNDGNLTNVGVCNAPPCTTPSLSCEDLQGPEPTCADLGCDDTNCHKRCCGAGGWICRNRHGVGGGVIGPKDCALLGNE